MLNGTTAWLSSSWRKAAPCGNSSSWASVEKALYTQKSVDDRLSGPKALSLKRFDSVRLALMVIRRVGFDSRYGQPPSFRLRSSVYIQTIH